MNYTRIYNNIISNARNENRIRSDKYFENHHIIPKCLNGKDDKENLVLLTAKEHYICHKLLTFMYPSNRDLACALHMMIFTCNHKIIHSSREYLYVREHLSKLSKGKNHPRYGKHHTEEAKEKMRKPHKKYSEEYLNNLHFLRSGKLNSMYGKHHTEESKEKNRISHLGKKHSDEAKNKMSLSKTGSKRNADTKEKMSAWQKGKTYEEKYGVEKAKILKEKLKKPKSEEFKRNLSKPRNFCWICNIKINEERTINKENVDKFLIENIDYKKGRLPMSAEQRKKLSETKKGKK